MKRCWFVTLGLVTFASITVACSAPDPTSPANTTPGIAVQITADSCPSIQVQAGLQITWTNQDRIARAVIIERTDASGAVIQSGGTDKLGPGDEFSTSLSEPGDYTYYCSNDRATFGTIRVLPGSYP